MLQVNWCKIKQETEPSHSPSQVLSEISCWWQCSQGQFLVWKCCLPQLTPLPSASPIHTCPPPHTGPSFQLLVSGLPLNYLTDPQCLSGPVLLLPSDVMIALYCSVTHINQYLLTWLCLEHFLCTKPIIVFSSLYFSVHMGTWPDCHWYFHGTLNSYKLQVLSESISPFKLKIKSEPLLRGLNVNRMKRNGKARQTH